MIRQTLPFLLMLLPLLARADIETNKAVVRGFYEAAFNRHQPAEAMERFVGTQYLQHNPYVANGKEPFIQYFTGFYKKNPEAKVAIKRMVAEGDLVVVHIKSTANEKDRGRAVVDIFRVTDGKITEHWDVGQAIPETSANSNTMF